MSLKGGADNNDGGDYLDGRGGNDTVSYASSNAGVTVTLGVTSLTTDLGGTIYYEAIQVVMLIMINC